MAGLAYENRNPSRINDRRVYLTFKLWCREMEMEEPISYGISALKKLQMFEPDGSK